MKLTKEQALKFKERYENRFDDEIITEPGAFLGLTVKVAQQIMVNLDKQRYIDWLINRFERFAKQEELDRAYDEQYNDATYVLLLVKHYISLEGSQLKERITRREQPPVSTYDAFINHERRYGYTL